MFSNLSGRTGKGRLPIPDEKNERVDEGVNKGRNKSVKLLWVCSFFFLFCFCPSENQKELQFCVSVHAKDRV